MQLVTMLGQMLESGKLTLSTNNKEDLEVTAINKKIDVNLKDKEFIKNLVSEVLGNSKSTSTMQTIKESPQRIKEVRNMRKMLIDTANELRQEGLTVTLSYKADVVATAGAQANSRISRLFTGTKALEINNLSKLAELGINIL